jgi:hypothetical protein
MELRNHPLMHYRGISNWPPVWVWIGGDKAIAKGEVGLLKDVKSGSNGHLNRFFLFVEYQGGAYVGCLLFDNHVFCRQIYSLLHGYRGRSIEFIGGLDVSYTL